MDGVPLDQIGQLLSRGQPLNDLGKEMLRRALMRKQMEEAQGVSDAVPRGPQPFQWAPPASHSLPELPTTYQPPARWNYGRPVRMA